MTSSYAPSRKWFAALAGSAGAILTHLAATGLSFGDTEQGMIITAISALVLAYIQRNQQTPGGVPAKTP